MGRAWGCVKVLLAAEGGGWRQVYLFAAATVLMNVVIAV
jgi:hypothetical protein